MAGRSPGTNGIAVPLIVVGAALLLSTIVLGWYTTSLGTGSSAIGETLYPTTVRIWGSQGGSTYSDAVLYPAAGMPHTGTMYLAITALLVTGGLAGLSAVYFMRTSGTHARRQLVSALVVLAVLSAVAGPTLLVVAQPGAICSDYVFVGTPFLTSPLNNPSGASLPCGWDITTPGGPGSGYGHVSGSTSGPQTSPWGSGNWTGEPHTWGPDIGWYVAWGATFVLLAGAVMHFQVGRKRDSDTPG
jgi:hypothetical protein